MRHYISSESYAVVDVSQAYIYSQGCQVGFYHGDMRALKDDLIELRPTIFTTVPRLLNRVYDKVNVMV